MVPAETLEKSWQGKLPFWDDWEEKAEAHRSPVDFLSHSASPSTSCGAELQ